MRGGPAEPSARLAPRKAGMNRALPRALAQQAAGLAAAPRWEAASRGPRSAGLPTPSLALQRRKWHRQASPRRSPCIAAGPEASLLVNKRIRARGKPAARTGPGRGPERGARAGGRHLGDSPRPPANGRPPRGAPLHLHWQWAQAASIWLTFPDARQAPRPASGTVPRLVANGLVISTCSEPQRRPADGSGRCDGQTPTRRKRNRWAQAWI